jgi:hypothetical protein
MRDQRDSPASEQRKIGFQEARREIGARVDAAISRIDADTPPGALDAAEVLISESAKLIEAIAVQEKYGDLQGATADVTTSVAQISELEGRKTAAEARLDALPECDRVQMITAVVYIVGALTAFLTEWALTQSLVDLLGYRRDDPTGRAIGAAFASAMLVFELIVTRLALAENPWPLFQASKSADSGQGFPRWLRWAGGVSLVLTLVAVGWLQIATVIKMAPTRAIEGAVMREQRGLTAREDQIVQDSTLIFSVCILISGGFMAAAGTKELSLWLQRRNLEKTIRDAEDTRLRIIAALTSTEVPKLEGALQSAGIPSLWLFTEHLEEAIDRLRADARSRLDGCGTPDGLRAAAGTEARMFEASWRIDLNLARAQVPDEGPVRSWREIVDGVIGRAVSRPPGPFQLARGSGKG